jgi:hypothetical protein
MLKFEIRNIIVDEEILGEVHLEFVNNIGVDTVKMREIEMQEKIRLKYCYKKGVYSENNSKFIFQKH